MYFYHFANCLAKPVCLDFAWILQMEWSAAGICHSVGGTTLEFAAGINHWTTLEIAAGINCWTCRWSLPLSVGGTTAVIFHEFS